MSLCAVKMWNPNQLHKAVAEVSKIGNPKRKIGCCESRQSESTDGPKGGWSCVFLSGHLTHNCWM